MLDIARKPFTAAWIEDRVRELGDLKFNELGLHFSDDQGFRIESTTHPEIVSKDHLTKAQVKQIVELAASLRHHRRARDRLPGHLGAVIAAHPDLQLRNVSGSPRAAPSTSPRTRPPRSSTNSSTSTPGCSPATSGTSAATSTRR